MSNSVERVEIVVRKPASVSLVVSNQPPHQPLQSVTRYWLADLASKPLGKCRGSAGHARSNALSLAIGSLKPLGSRQTNRAANYPNTNQWIKPHDSSHRLPVEENLTREAVVIVLEDDASVRAALKELIESVGPKARLYASAACLPGRLAIPDGRAVWCSM